MSLGEKLGIPLILSDETLASIGALTNSYSYMELLAAAAAWHSLGLLGYAKITADDIAVIKDIESEFSKEGGISSQRNAMIHGVWSVEETKLPYKARPISFSRNGKVLLGEETTDATVNNVTLAIAVQIKRMQVLLRNWDALDNISFQKPSASP
jgi:hypothetical protein